MWKKIFEEKIVTAEEAVKNIKSNDKVVVGHAAAEPLPILDAMVANKKNYSNVEIFHMVPMGKAEYVEEGMEEHFIHNSLFAGGSVRKAINEGRSEYTPYFLSEVPRFFQEQMRPDVALIQVSSPDEHGYCSYGISNDYTKASAEASEIIIAEMNDQMPRVLGYNFIHVSDIDHIVETSRPLIELEPAEIGDVERAIGENCASLIEDGATLQLGIGAIPDAVLLFLKDKKDLGIHSEMISDGVVELVEAGVITNKRKTLHPEKIIVTFLMGTKRLYDFADNNQMFEMHPSSYTNDPFVIMKNDNMVAINSCVQVDLMGQVVSSSIGENQISGVGGQVDFVRGARRSKGGKSIIAMPSTAAGGKVSRIVSMIDSGAAVTTSRNDVDYIVTEYGIAKLIGKTLKERAEALIEIAHPDFRDSLRTEYEEKLGRLKG